MQPENIVPVILAGGEGRRLRPLTAPMRPKPFLKLFSKYSLLQLTMRRCRAFAAPVVICDRQFAGQAQREARDIGQHARVIAEPMQRGTAAAIICAAFLLREENPFMVVMPSDHVIIDDDIFSETVQRATRYAEEGPVILGKKPDGPAERYGYIKTKPIENEAFQLDHFIEKPHLKLARRLFQTPHIFWNTGVFICRTRILLDLFQRHAPDIYAAAERSMDVLSSGDVCRPDPALYSEIPKRAIDYAIMEKLHPDECDARVLPLETGWHDVGCWERVFALKLKSFTGSLQPHRYELQRTGSKSA